MSSSSKVNWRIAGEEVGSCNCAWGCPCQFNALPTKGNCEALLAWQILQGHYGDTQLGGIRFARMCYWPGPIHEGNGTMQMIIDERASPGQREALAALDAGTQGGAYWEIFAAVCPHRLEPMVAPITLEINREKRKAVVRIPGIAESLVEPIRNPVTKEEHRARIVLPNGFEYKEAELGDSVSWKVTASGKLAFEHQHSYAQLNAFDWSNY